MAGARHRRRRALRRRIHLFSAYRALGYREGQFPNAERIGRETVTLPLFPAMELVRRGARGRGRPPTILRGAREVTATLSVVIPVYNEEEGLSAAVRAAVPGARCSSGAPTRWYSSMTAAATAPWRCCASSSSGGRMSRAWWCWRATPGQHMAILAALRAYARHLRDHPRCGPAEPARGDRQARRRHGRRAPTTSAPSACAATMCCWRKAASRLMNRMRERTTSIRITDQGCMLRGYHRSVVEAINRCIEVEHLRAGAGLYLRAPPGRDRSGARRAHRRAVEVFAATASSGSTST